ncbi:MAG: bi-domain-containing oxidoreductase [Pseudomonadota bacterium]
MKQVLQSLSNGRTSVQEVPAPAVRAGHLQIVTSTSLVSPGTERMLVDFGRGSLVSKARQQPEKVNQALEKMKTDGIAATLDAIRSKLDQPLALGYCNVGRVATVGDGCDQFETGDRVASNGKHAEVTSVAKHLCAKIPDNVSDDAAAFTVIGAIALQGIRLAAPTMGETFAVTGLGLVGLMAVQLLRANGCRVIGLDFDAERLELAARFGAETIDISAEGDPLAKAQELTQGRGVDGVLLTAATQSSEPVSQAARMCRQRGRIVLVGVTGLELARSDFFEKELTFQVSCSYGPGRYDPAYEEKGQDYPLGHVRWTEQRNFEAVLDLMSRGAIDVAPLISHKFKIEEAAQAYKLLASEEPSLGIIIDYPAAPPEGADVSGLLDCVVSFGTGLSMGPPERGSVGFIGAGNFGGRVLVPAFKAADAYLRTIASVSGVSAVHFGNKHGFEKATSNVVEVIGDNEIDTVVISSRHDTHKQFVMDGLIAKKTVFVEKPLCLNEPELQEIERLCRQRPDARLMVGYNRRFAPTVRKMDKLLRTVEAPKVMTMTVNAGFIPADHWTQDPTVGGGRIIGECCHFVDLLRFLAGARITDVQAAGIARDRSDTPADTASVTLRFEDGSVGIINYLSNGHKGFPKERLEVFSGGRILMLDNFRKLSGHGWRGFARSASWRQDKGHKACARAFMDAVRTGNRMPIPQDELFEVSRTTFEIARQLG